MKYKVTLNNRVYEVEVEQGEAMLVDEYELAAPAAPAPAAAAAPAKNDCYIYNPCHSSIYILVYY